MNLTVFSLLSFGFLLGMKHALDADHIVAISTIESENKSIKKASLSGIFWGFGHAISLLVVGFIMLLFKLRIPEKISLSLEFIVGIMLIVLGLNVLIPINKNKIHLHKHKHGNIEHIHFHSHMATKAHNHNHNYKSFFIGLFHGLAGSAALALFVLTTINIIWLGLIYILIFSIGSAAGMMLVSGVISMPFKLISYKLEKAQKILSITAGLISTLFGFTIIYEIGFAGGLLI